MGPVITINSATLVNKGLEVIEAHLLFGLPFDRIEVVVHPTSVVHSMVEFVDGSTLAQAEPADDADPDRARPGVARPGARRGAAPVDWTQPETWEFFPLDDEAFPAVALAREAGARGGTAPGGLQRGERGLRRGLPGRAALPFTDIVRHRSRAVLARHDVPSKADSLTVDDVLAADAWARAGRRRPDRETAAVTAAALHPGRRGLRSWRIAGLDRAARARPHDPRASVRR